MKTNNPQTHEVIKRKMCECAEIDYDTVNWHDGSHLKLTWNHDQMSSFVDWMANEIHKNASFRKAVAKYPALAKSKSASLAIAKSFEAQYGFAYK